MVGRNEKTKHPQMVVSFNGDLPRDRIRKISPTKQKKNGDFNFEQQNTKKTLRSLKDKQKHVKHVKK